MAQHTHNTSSQTVSTPWFNVAETTEGLCLRFGGSWTCRTVGSMESELHPYHQGAFLNTSSLHVQIEKGCLMDTAGACLIAGLIKTLKSQKRTVKVTAPSSVSALLDFFLHFQPAVEPFKPRLSWQTRLLDRIGYGSLAVGKTSLKMLAFLGEILVTLFHEWKKGLPIRWVSVFRHGEDIGVKALPIVGLISFLIGMVLSYQSINQLKRFGAELYTIDFLGISILREIAVLLTAIVVAGRTGSAFAAQIGTMALNQEIDAIRMLGLNPMLVLVAPRLIAITVCLPLLVFFSMIMGLLGGMVVVNLSIDVTPIQFSHHFQQSVTLTTFWVGMSKAPLFAVIIGMVGSFRGFQVKGSATSVGRMTTQAVVESIFLVIVCDAFMSILFSYMGV